MEFVDNKYRELFSGLDLEVPVLDGTMRMYVNLDNAASTPAMRPVENAVSRFLEYYSSVHRGTGFKSQISTYAYEEARHKVLKFVGANALDHTCIFGKNTTEMINRLARRFPFSKDRNVVIVSMMEHHSNDLPWRGAAEVVHVAVLADGRLDEADFEQKLVEYKGRVALVAITGASNVTGYINPIDRLAEKTHAAGAQFAVDCAQLAPHRKVNMGSLADPQHLDYVVLSAHKMYAPYGTGALVGLRSTFETGEPDHKGGGQVEFVSLDSVVWSGTPERDESGSPNVVGAVAFGAAITQFEAIGMQAVAEHEAELTAYLLERIQRIPGLICYGEKDPARASERVGVIPFQMKGMSHFLVGAILGYEFGIGVRSGCFCAHPYLLRLLHISDEEAENVRAHILGGDRSHMPGLVRASFGLYNNRDDIDCLIEALGQISKGAYRGTYIQDVHSGEYLAQNWNVKYEDYFKF